MDICMCIQFVSKQDDDDVCECGHDYIDHLQQVIGSCGARTND